MALSVLSLLVPLVVVIGVAVAVGARPKAGAVGSASGAPGGSGGLAPEGHLVRRFFQYVLLFGLLVVAASGLSGLVGRLLSGDTVLAESRGALALNVAFTVVGVPLFAGLAWWTRKRLASDPGEVRSLGWTAYVTIAGLTSVSVALVALVGVLAWALRVEDYDADALAQLLVWGAVWAGHWWWESRVTPPPLSRLHHQFGSLIGLVVCAVGLGQVIAGLARVALGLDGRMLYGDSTDPIRAGLVLLLAGLPVWIVYWVRTAARANRDVLWLGYVLLAGVGGGLITAVVAASNAAYDVLVWFVGQPSATSMALHFDSLPGTIGAALAGALVWWYHRSVLEQAGAVASARTEVRRVYEYLMSAIGLAAAAAGVTMVLVALIEAVAGTSALLAGRGAVNSLLAALTLIGVGGPVWVIFWGREQRAVAAEKAPADTADTADPADGAELVERRSVTRRTYLFLLFGVVGVAAVIALLVGVYMLFEDVLGGGFGAETLRRMRFALGVLVTTAGVAWYHWTIYRADQAVLATAPVAVPVPAPESVPGGAEGGASTGARHEEEADGVRRGPPFVLLLGPSDGDLAAAVARVTGGRVEAWARWDVPWDPASESWSAQRVLAAVQAAGADEVVVLGDGDELRVIPVRRS